MSLTLISRHTEGRRGYEAGDALPLTNRFVYLSEQEAMDAMKNSPVAFEVWELVRKTNAQYSISILAKYIRIERPKTSKPWQKVGEAFGSCLADAHDKFPGLENLLRSLNRVVYESEWREIEAKEHLKAIGHK